MGRKRAKTVGRPTKSANKRQKVDVYLTTPAMTRYLRENFPFGGIFNTDDEILREAMLGTQTILNKYGLVGDDNAVRSLTVSFSAATENLTDKLRIPPKLPGTTGEYLDTCGLIRGYGGTAAFKESFKREGGFVESLAGTVVPDMTCAAAVRFMEDVFSRLVPEQPEYEVGTEKYARLWKRELSKWIRADRAPDGPKEITFMVVDGATRRGFCIDLNFDWRGIILLPHISFYTMTALASKMNISVAEVLHKTSLMQKILQLVRWKQQRFSQDAMAAMTGYACTLW